MPDGANTTTPVMKFPLIIAKRAGKWVMKGKPWAK
jgi:hypothetical protein